MADYPLQICPRCGFPTHAQRRRCHNCAQLLTRADPSKPPWRAQRRTSAPGNGA